MGEVPLYTLKYRDTSILSTPNTPASKHPPRYNSKREFFTDNLLVRIHLLIEMNLVNRPCAMGFEFPLNVADWGASPR